MGATNKHIKGFFFCYIWCKTKCVKSSSGILYMYYMIEGRIWHMLSLLSSERVTLWTTKWCLFQVLNVAGALITIQPTCQQALFSWNLAGTPQQIPCWNLDDHIPKLEEFFFLFFCSFFLNVWYTPLLLCWPLHFKKHTQPMQEGKHQRTLQVSC